MWEEIQANQRRSAVLIALMGTLLVVLGAVVGLSVSASAEGAAGGALIAALIWLVLWFFAVVGGKKALLSVAHARKIEKRDAPQLWNVVEEVCIAAGLTPMPEVYIIDSDERNAFAVGYSPERSAVAVTSGLLKTLTRDELQGVLAHEVGHIINRDIRFMTLAGVMLGAVVLIADVFVRGMLRGRRGRRSSSKGGQAEVIFLIVALVLAILAPILAQLLYYACSRRREYLADATGARLTRLPEGLASALEKIARQPGRADQTSRVLAPMYIVNPLAAVGSFTSWFSTHPPTDQRIKILRSMAGGAGYLNYDQAFRKVTRGPGVLGAGFLRGLKEETVEVRAASAEPSTREQAVSRARDVGDMVDRMANFAFLACPCGVRVKLPPGFKKDKVRCPRCGAQIQVNSARA